MEHLLVKGSVSRRNEFQFLTVYTSDTEVFLAATEEISEHLLLEDDKVEGYIQGNSFIITNKVEQ